MTTKSLIQKLLGQYKTYGQTFLYTPEFYLYCFPKETLNDLVIQVQNNLFIEEPIYFDKNGEKNKSVSDKDVRNLYEHVRKLEVIYDEEFNINKIHIRAIQDLIKESKAPYTHIRFFSENNQVKVRIFDYTSFVSELYAKDKPITIYEEVIEDTFISNDFSFSLNVLSFKEVQVNDFTVQTFGDEYIKFSDVSGVSYFLRNQNIQEPIVKITNAQIPQDIVFCFQPTTNVASDYTNL